MSNVRVPLAVTVVVTVSAGRAADRVVRALLALAPAAITPNEAVPYGVRVVTVAAPGPWLADRDDQHDLARDGSWWSPVLGSTSASTVMVTVTGADSSDPSFAVYVKVSVPENPASGV